MEILTPKTRGKIKKRIGSIIPDFPIPQPKQKEFLVTSADIALFGGAAGSGKSLAILLDFARPELLVNHHYGGVIFRRTYPEIRNEGGLWDESGIWYPKLGAIANESRLTWKFPSGATIRFSHLQHEKDIYRWQGAQVARVGFDELTHFSKKQFFYLLTRMRSLTIAPKLRATCNPDAESWLAEFIDWWINEQGYPYPERSGVLRYFITHHNEIIWDDSAIALQLRYPGCNPKSFTFISAKLTDNPALLQKDPAYLSNLEAQDSVERSRLLDGNWHVKKSDSRLFNIVAIEQSCVGLWIPPKLGGNYIIGIDPNFGGDDYFVCQVWDITLTPYTLVAQYREQRRSMTYSVQQCDRHLKAYRPVVTAIEKNSGGIAVLEGLIAMNPGLRIEGISTTQASKVIMTDRLAIALESGLLVFPFDWAGIEELKGFSKTKRMAISGHDDCVMAAAIAFTQIETALRISSISPLLFS